MSVDYLAQIQSHIQYLNDLAENSAASTAEIEKAVSDSAVQVGDYLLPQPSGDPIAALNSLDALIDELSENLSQLNPMIEGARVPEVPSDLYDITPEDMIRAINSLQSDPAPTGMITVSPSDINEIDLCTPAAAPAPQITMEGFLRLCQDVKPPQVPNNVVRPSEKPNQAELLKDLGTVPDDNPGDPGTRNSEMAESVNALLDIFSYGTPKDSAISELSTTEIGRLILEASDLNGTEASDVLPEVINPDRLYSGVLQANLDAREDYPAPPADKVALDCVSIMMPIIEESQVKAGRFAEVKKRISDIQQIAEVGSVFLAFWENVDSAINDSSLLELNALGDAKRELEEKKAELEQKYGSIGLVASGGKTVSQRPEYIKLEKEIDEITKKQDGLLKNKKITVRDLRDFQKLDEKLNGLVGDLSVEVEINYDAHKSPRFNYNKSKQGQNSDRRLQKLQKRLVAEIRKIDMSSPDGVKKIQDVQSFFDNEYITEIYKTREAVSKAGAKWGLLSIVSGGGFRGFVRSKTSEQLKEMRATYEPLIVEYRALKVEEGELQSYMDNLSETINETLRLNGCEPLPVAPPPLDAGHDINYKNIPMNAQTSPNIFDMRWWVKFCMLASVVNLVPVHWPVGLILPTIPKPLFIPCPIIWFPLAVFNTPVALIVILIGQCGILPSPFVFVLNTAPFPLGPLNPRSCWFPVAIRPMCHIKDNPRSERLQIAPMLQIPMVNLELIRKQIESTRGQISENLSQISANASLASQLRSEYETEISNIDPPQANSGESSTDLGASSFQLRDQIDADFNRRVSELSASSQELVAKNSGLLKQIAGLTSALALGPATATIELDPLITKSMPLYVDDFPTWERLSLTNIPFLTFLWKWCAAGKNGGGFLRDPI